jgi:hypothetical protein
MTQALYAQMNNKKKIKKRQVSGVVAHACNPSILEAEARS